MLNLAAGGQANAETSINANFVNVLWAELFAMDPAVTGITTLLTFGVKGGQFPVNGVLTTIADVSLTLTASTTHFIGITQAGIATATATTANPLHVPLFTVVTGATTITSILDTRTVSNLQKMPYGITTVTITDVATAATLTQAQALCDTVNTSVVAFTAQRNLVVPLVKRMYTVRNNATGFGLQVIGATGTGIVIGVAKCAIVECDGTNVLRITADV